MLVSSVHGGSSLLRRLRLTSTTSHTIVETPAALLFTRQGSPPSIMPDQLESMPSETRQTSLNVAFAEVRSLLQHASAASYAGTLASLVVQPLHALYVSAAAPSAAPIVAVHKEAFVAVGDREGHVVCSFSDYARLMRYAAPQMLQSPCTTLRVDVGSNRARKATTAAADALRACCDALSSDGGAAQSSASTVMASVLGVERERERAASLDAAVAEASRVLGFALVVDADADADAQTALTRDVMRRLHDAAPLKPRMLQTIDGAPAHVLQLVAAGADLVCATYPTRMADVNRALTFRWSTDGYADDATDAADAHAIDVGDARHCTDQRPLVRGCPCEVCTHHTRGYLQHLIATNELLGCTFLHIHNVAHYQRFFASIRSAIEKGQELPTLKKK